MSKNATELAGAMRQQIAHLLAGPLPNVSPARAGEIAEAIDMLIMLRIAEREEQARGKEGR